MNPLAAPTIIGGVVVVAIRVLLLCAAVSATVRTIVALEAPTIENRRAPAVAQVWSARKI